MYLFMTHNGSELSGLVFLIIYTWKFIAISAERLRPLTSIPEVPGSNPGPAVASLGKALSSHCLVFRRRL